MHSSLEPAKIKTDTNIGYRNKTNAIKQKRGGYKENMSAKMNHKQSEKNKLLLSDM